LQITGSRQSACDGFFVPALQVRHDHHVSHESRWEGEGLLMLLQESVSGVEAGTDDDVRAVEFPGD